MATQAKQLEIDFGDIDTATMATGPVASGNGVDTFNIDFNMDDLNYLGGGTITLPSNNNYYYPGDYISTYDISSSVSMSDRGIEIKEGCDITVGGRSVLDAIAKIEQRLAILKPNPELESRWEELKQLRDRYHELEKELLEKEKMWDLLKED